MKRSNASQRCPAHRWSSAALAVTVLGLGLGGCDFDEILSVELPGQVLASDLENRELANILVRSVISDVECSWSHYVAAAAHHGDEYMNSSGNLWFRNWGQRRIEANDERFSSGTCNQPYAFYGPLHTARFQAEDIYRRLTSEAFDGIPDLERSLATVRAYGAFALVALGEGFCEMSVPDEEGVPGPHLTPSQVLERAEARFTEALSLAEQANNNDIRQMALIGRARVRLNLGDFTGAITDAGEVTPGYVKVATRGDGSTRRFNFSYNSLNSRIQARHGTISDHFRNLTIDAQGRPTIGDGAEDPRVVTFPVEGLSGHNGTTPSWFHDKYLSRSDPITIASYKEARLIQAEALVRAGDPEAARGIINSRRSELALPTFDLPASEAEMIDLVLEERRRDLFVEGGHRFNDMLRYRGTPHEIPFLGEPTSIHPDGLDTIGAAYGDATCFPLPALERIGNPNVP
jgi:hypothetical protein